MTKKMRVGVLATLACLFAIGAQPSLGQNIDLESSVVLYHYQGRLLRDSRWGKIAVFQQALSEKLIGCGENGIEVDGFFGKGTQKGLMRLLSCPDFAAFAVRGDHRLHETVHTALWQKMRSMKSSRGRGSRLLRQSVAA